MQTSPLRPLINRRRLPARTAKGAALTAKLKGSSAVEARGAARVAGLLQRALLLEPCLATLPWRTLLSLGRLSRAWRALCDDEETATTIWRLVCGAFARRHGLFCPYSGDTGVVSVSEWRTVFVDDLWPARKKWRGDLRLEDGPEVEEDEPTDFKIKVSVRFRAGEEDASEKRLELPLHQLLKLRRHQNRGDPKKKTKGRTGRDTRTNRVAFGGRVTPPMHLCDAMTSNLLVHPRRFPSSQKVMDLKTIRPMLRRDPHDPFDGTPCTFTDLLPCPQLEAELAAWNATPAQKNGGSNDASSGLNQVGIDAVKKMAESGAELSPEVLEMLLDAEQLQQQLQQAEANAHRQESAKKSSAFRTAGGIDLEQETSPPGTPSPVDGAHGSDVTLSSAVHINATSTDNDGNSAFAATLPLSHGRHRHQRKRDQPRLLSVQSSRVNFFVPGTGVRQFHFPRCFDGTASQRDVYSQCARSTVMASLNGISSCVLSYGQTGSGKTYTQFGPEGWTDTLDAEMRDGRPLTTSGCVIRGIADIVAAMEEARARGAFSLSVSATYTQVYNNRVSDLLTGRPCSVARETGEITGAQSWDIRTMTDAVDLLREGEQRKTFEATAMNGRSSRAHTIFALTLTQVRRDGSGRMVKSNLFFVDLAGSERVKRSKVRGGALTEAIGINQSLSVLGRVIKDLMTGAHHVPYLESRLTTLLRQCFGGNCLTRVLVSCRSDQSHSEESLNSLRFGERCSRICNQVSFATSSVGAALAQVDEALAQVDRGLAGMEERIGGVGRGLPAGGHAMSAALSKLRRKREMLCLKRKDLAKLV